jgi:di/tricarboxylate transporter
MPSTILGLPLHPLVVHAVVVLVPLAALMLAASAVSTRFRRWALYATPVAAVLGLVLVPVATSSGENLERSVQSTPTLQEHTELGDTLLPFMIVLTVLALAVLVLERRRAVPSTDGPGATRAGARSDVPSRLDSPVLVRAVAVLALVASLATLVQVVRIGHSGANAVWKGTTQSSSGSGE